MNIIRRFKAQSPASQIKELLNHVSLPIMHRIRQKFDRNTLPSLRQHIQREIAAAVCSGFVNTGMNLAIAVGSRGIRNIAEIVKETVLLLKEHGIGSYIVPAMGSHGGATIAGQLEILSSLGITESSVGALIRATNDTVTIGKTSSGLPVYLDSEADKADGILVINRIKPHTAFRGAIESGLLKMCVVGLGKQPGAQSFHSGGMERMSQSLMEMGQVALRHGKILFGLAILENAYDETMDIIGVSAKSMMELEPMFLERAKAAMPKLPVKDIDVLMVDEIGKDISGDSMDPNITGRFYSPAVYGLELPSVQRIVACDMTDGSHGNCIGLGVADFITNRLFRKLDLNQVYMNALTNCVLEPAKIPIVMEDEELALKAAIATCLHIDKEHPRVVHIKNTLSLEYVEVSEALLEEVLKNPSIELVKDSRLVGL